MAITPDVEARVPVAPRHLPRIEDQATIDSHVFKAFCIAKGFCVSSHIAHGGRIENDEVREHVDTETRETEPVRRVTACSQ